MLYVTRRQLKQYGVSQYLATQLTKKVKVIGKQGRSFIYDHSQVIAEAENKILNKRIRKTTYKILSQLIKSFKENRKEIQDNKKIISFGQYLASQNRETTDFLVLIESNMAEMREIRDQFREIVEEAKKHDPTAFTQKQDF